MAIQSVGRLSGGSLSTPILDVLGGSTADKATPEPALYTSANRFNVTKNITSPQIVSQSGRWKQRTRGFLHDHDLGAH